MCIGRHKLRFKKYLIGVAKVCKNIISFNIYYVSLCFLLFYDINYVLHYIKIPISIRWFEENY